MKTFSGQKLLKKVFQLRFIQLRYSMNSVKVVGKWLVTGEKGWVKQAVVKWLVTGEGGWVKVYLCLLPSAKLLLPMLPWASFQEMLQPG